MSLSLSLLRFSIVKDDQRHASCATIITRGQSTPGLELDDLRINYRESVDEMALRIQL